MVRSRYLSWLLVLGGLLLWRPAIVGAAPAPVQGITLSPFEESININPGDVEKSFTLSLTNHTATLQELNLSIRDFGSLNNTGGVILEGSNAYTQKYGLASWLSLEKNTVDLNPGETGSVLVSVNNQSSLSPGGHYGAIVASVNSLNLPANNNVVINQQLVSLILVDKVGGDHFDLKLNSLTSNGNWLHLPSSATLTFQNPGNVHVVPRGLVQLVSPSGRVLAQGIINSQSAFVLPETFRELQVPLTPVNKQIILPGPYHLRVQYRYDGITRYATKNYYLNFIDLKLYVVLLIVVLVIGRWLLRRFRRRETLGKNPR